MLLGKKIFKEENKAAKFSQYVTRVIGLATDKTF